MQTSSDFSLLSVVEPNIIALKLLGFWRSPTADTIFSTVWYKTYTVLMLFFPAVLNITGFWYLYDKRKNLTVEDISSVIFIYPTCLINMLMMVVIYVHIDMIHFIQSEMKAERFQPKTSAQLADAKKWKRTARLFQKVVTCAASCMTCSTYVTLVTSLVIEIIIQLCLLERALQAMEDDMDLKNCVQWHLDILVFVKKVQKFCGVGVSAVFICGIFNICTSLALTLTAEVSDLPFFLLYLGAMVSIIYSHCWCGSEVTHQSDKISNAIYNSKWTNADASYMKLINIHILLTQQPLEIPLGGGTFSASLPVFVMIIKTAYSVLTVLQRLDD